MKIEIVFQFSTINIIAVNILVHIFFCGFKGLFMLGICLKVKLLGHRVDVHLTLLEWGHFGGWENL